MVFNVFFFKSTLQIYINLSKSDSGDRDDCHQHHLCRRDEGAWSYSHGHQGSGCRFCRYFELKVTLLFPVFAMSLIMPDIHQILSKSGLKTHADPEFKDHSRCTEPAYHSFANANPTPKEHDQHDSSKDRSVLPIRCQ